MNCSLKFLVALAAPTLAAVIAVPVAESSEGFPSPSGHAYIVTVIYLVNIGGIAIQLECWYFNSNGVFSSTALPITGRWILGSSGQHVARWVAGTGFPGFVYGLYGRTDDQGGLAAIGFTEELILGIPLAATILAAGRATSGSCQATDSDASP